jgi:hypothetical protein
MKLKNMMNGGLLAVALALLAAPAARAGFSAPYTNGDWLMGFYSTGAGGTTDTLDYVLNLGVVGGNVSTSWSDSSTGLASALSTAFGSNWYGNVYYGVIATNGGVGSGLTIELSNPDPAQGAWPSQVGEGTISNDIIDVGQAASQQSETHGEQSGIIQAVTGANTVSDNWESMVDNGFGVYGNADSTGDGYISDVTSNPLEFDYMRNTSGQPQFPILGTFSLDSAGDISFASTGEVPEPSTFAALGLGAAVLAFAGRRRLRA